MMDDWEIIFILLTYLLLLVELFVLVRAIYLIITRGDNMKLEIKFILYICGSDLCWCIYTIGSFSIYLSPASDGNSLISIITSTFFNSYFINCSIAFSVIIAFAANNAINTKCFCYESKFQFFRLLGFIIPSVISLLY